MASDTLAHFANFKLAGDRIVRDAISSFQSSTTATLGADPRDFGRSARSAGAGSGSRRRRRRGGTRTNVRVGAMSDAELEAELTARRTARAAERQRYARAMRSEKLAALEDELVRLRGEISKIDPAIPRRVAGIGGSPTTSSHVTWGALPGAGSRPDANTQQGAPAGGPPAGGPPPPPGPPPTLVSNLGEEEDPIDPETRKKEKAERQRRREEKRKAREAAAKPMTLADIIRSAGPDPIKMLKPRSEKVEEAAPAQDPIAALKDSLKKVEPHKPDEEKGKAAGPGESSAQNPPENVAVATSENQAGPVVDEGPAAGEANGGDSTTPAATDASKVAVSGESTPVSNHPHQKSESVAPSSEATLTNPKVATPQRPPATDPSQAAVSANPASPAPTPVPSQTQNAPSPTTAQTAPTSARATLTSPTPEAAPSLSTMAPRTTPPAPAAAAPRALSATIEPQSKAAADSGAPSEHSASADAKSSGPPVVPGVEPGAAASRVSPAKPSSVATPGEESQTSAATLSALSALTAKLPSVKASGVKAAEATDVPARAKRTTLAEKRKARRSANAAGTGPSAT